MVLTLALCFSLRFSACILLPQEASDSSAYITLGKNIAAHSNYSLDGTTPYAYRAPGYPFFLSVFYKCGFNNPAILRMANAGIDTATCLILLTMITMIGGSFATMLLAGLLFTCHPILIASTTFILSETWATFILILSLFWCVNALQNKKIASFVLAGMCFAATILVKPSFIAAPLTIVIATLIFRRDLFLRALLLALVCFALLTPWSIRNYQAFNSFIPMSSQSGLQLWVGSAKEYDGLYHDDMRKEIQRVQATLPPGTIGFHHVDNVLRKEALTRIMADPIGYTGFYLSKMIPFWLRIPGEQALLTGRKNLGIAIRGYHYLVLLMAIGGMAIGLKKKKLRTVSLFFLMMIAYTTVIHILLGSLPRFYIPILPIVILFAALGASNRFKV